MIHTIKKGNHYSRIPFPVLHFGDTMEYTVTFDESCRYITKDPNNQTDANKLFGFTDGLSGVHNNSARFGWHYDHYKDMIILHKYCYIDGKLINTEIGLGAFYSEIRIGMPVRLKIVNWTTRYEFSVYGMSVYVTKFKKVSPVSFKCFPYFGGDETARHDIFIKME